MGPLIAAMHIVAAIVFAPKFDLSILVVIPFVALFMVLIFPWPITRYLLIPLGLTIPAFGVAHLSMITWGFSPRGGGYVAAAWALLRNKQRHEEEMDWLENHLGEALRMNVPELVAHALLTAARGQPAHARKLMESVEILAKDQPNNLARVVALEWLTADAAQRGDWARVEKTRRRSGLMACSRATVFLGEVAARMLGTDEIPIWRLWLLWAVAPRRLHTFPILQRALKQLPGTAAHPVPDEVVLPAEADEDVTVEAMTLHIALLKRPASEVLGKDIARLCNAWDRALSDDALRAHATVRALNLQHSDPDAALETFTKDVYSDIASIAKAARLNMDELGDRGPTLSRVARAFQGEAIQELELSAEALAQRVDARRTLPTIDEWREFIALRSLHAQTSEIGGQRFRRLAFSVVHPPICSLAVWLYNERKEKYAAHAIFLWLLAEAEAVGDEDAIRLQRENCRQSRG